ncbi:CLUMA_CG006932, isoform A [Clunio marinus]|uniref:CLUMA_CG006932, isoform A n=1 Tax=Clunio marinus TaxID=568069 RepID=A0A1J1I1C5_9DIPT|nr:CLUMA_CG006932, isoform A [Clunio marinus]
MTSMFLIYKALRSLDSSFHQNFIRLTSLKQTKHFVISSSHKSFFIAGQFAFYYSQHELFCVQKAHKKVKT